MTTVPDQRLRKRKRRATYARETIHTVDVGLPFRSRMFVHLRLVRPRKHSLDSPHLGKLPLQHRRLLPLRKHSLYTPSPKLTTPTNHPNPQISILNYLPNAYPDHIASVNASNNFIRCTCGAECVLFAAPMYERLGHVWASALLGFLGLAFVPVPFLFYFWGGRVRRGSRCARQDF